MASTAGKPFPDRGSKLTLGFGLVSVPVAMKPLGESKRPISGKGMCSEHGPLEVGSSQQVCGRGTDHEHVLDKDEKMIGYPHPHDPTRYVHVDPDVVKSLQEPRTGTARIEAVIDVDTIDPGYLAKAYVVWPQPGGEEAFALFATVLREKGMAAACTAVLTKQTQSIVFRWSEHFGCVLGHVVQFESMIRHGDVELVRTAMESQPEPAVEMIDMAAQVLGTLSADFRPSDAQDRITPQLQQAIIASAEGTTFTVVEDAPPVEDAGDLMAALQASLGEALPAKRPAAKRPAAKKPPAKRPAAKKPPARKKVAA